MGAISSTTRLTGVIGWPVSHSLSPAMHNAAFRHLGLDWVYLPLAVRPGRLAEALAGLAALGFAGANITVPHKTAALPLMDNLAPAARATAAVNTVVVLPDGSLLGDNTDVSGFSADFAGLLVTPAPSAATSPHKGAWGAGIRALVLGAGGAARAVSYALLDAGATIAVAGRTAAHIDDLCQSLARGLPEAAGRISGHPFPQALSRLAEWADVIVNATSLGLASGDPLPWDPAVPFRPGQVVYDLVYNRPTELVALARRAGARAAGGAGMLLHQGARAFELWTGQPAPLAVMREALQQRVTAHQGASEV